MEITIDPVTKTLIREGVSNVINPFDAFAVELAVRLKEKNGGSVTVISMGPSQAETALRECLSLGADRAVLVTDSAFGGSDTLATSYILSNAVKKLGGFDIIFCGKQAIDGDTGQVGPELAECLNIAQVTYAFDVHVDGDKLICKRENDEGYEIVESSVPAVVTIIKSDDEPRRPSIRSVLAAKKSNIKKITLADLPEIDQTKIGLMGSPTRVKKTFTPDPRNKAACVKIADKNGKDSAHMLLSFLVEKELIQL
jgi:electron transfer flavoprotein beta subunit